MFEGIFSIKKDRTATDRFFDFFLTTPVSDTLILSPLSFSALLADFRDEISRLSCFRPDLQSRTHNAVEDNYEIRWEKLDNPRLTQRTFSVGAYIPELHNPISS